MKLIIMRHGEARATTGEGDAARKLTPRGEQEAAQGGAWLREQFGQLDWVMCSPLIRARQTLAIVDSYISSQQSEVSPDITPQSNAADFASALLARLQIEPAETVLLVSHMPFVSELAGYLDRSMQPPLFPCAGIAVLDVEPLEMAGSLQLMAGPPDYKTTG